MNTGGRPPSSEVVETNVRNRIVLAHAAIAVVLVLVAATALVALRTTRQDAEEARTIDHRLAAIDRLRAESRELAVSARRYMMSGDLQEQQRVFAIVHDMQAERARLGLRTAVAKGAMLEADLEEYVAALSNAMSFEDGDPIARLSHFEDELVRIRAPLTTTFDDIVSHERARRDALRSAHVLARGAQWAVLIAGALGVVLVIATLRAVMRRVGSTSTVEPDGTERVAALRPHSLRRERLDVAGLLERSVRRQREEAQQRGIRMRYEAQLGLTVVADRARIQHVLDSLLQIAIAAARAPVELVIHVAGADGGARFAIVEPEPGDAPPSDFAIEVCTRIIEAHGGRLGIQTSAVSRTYWFTLPGEPRLLG